MPDRCGRVIRPALLWNDTRSAKEAEALNEEIRDIIARTGLRMVALTDWVEESTPITNFLSVVIGKFLLSFSML
jgi:sugar (pentulose or hexulose) kinase